MLDIQFIRENKDTVKKATEQKQVDVDIDRLLALDDQRRQLQSQAEALRHERKELAAAAGNNKPDDNSIQRGRTLKQELSDCEDKLQNIDTEYKELLLRVPNVFSEDTPIGKDEDDNKVVSTWGKVPSFDFEVKDHVELGESLGVIDTERAAKVSGARFSYIKGDLALLQFALTQFVFQTVASKQTIEDIIVKEDLNIVASAFTAVVPPVLVRPDTMQRMARLEPKEDRFITLGEEFALVGSAEHSMGAMYMDEILEKDDLPLRFIGYSSAFRREAGSYGKDTRGILRQHQFDKLEMETFSTGETGLDEHYLMVAIQEHIMQSLQLPYQKVAISSGDMGAPDYKQTDLEAWLPAQNAFRETHTADYVTDYQARRLKTRYKHDETTQYVHMNDATAAAVGRTLIAIMENYQTSDGHIRVPEVLQPYMGKDII